MQYVNIGPRCTKGVTIHEIAHAIGFWHEQSRPDRDNYVNVLYSQIPDDAKTDYMRRSHHDVDYQGTIYDYGSIMHYPLSSVMSISNQAAYNAQGRPTVGQTIRLSARDIIQANRLYRCPGPGQKGKLRVYVRYAKGLPDTDGPFNKPDPYVVVKAVTSTGAQLTRKTSKKNGKTSPTYYENVEFGASTWQFIRVRVWDSDVGGDDAMTQSQTIPIGRTSRHFIKHCASTKCSGYLYLDYIFTPDGDECATKPCLNGGTCIDGNAQYTCRCRSGYAGPRCQFLKRRLRVYVRYGRNLPDRDGPFGGDSDPYVRFIARDSDGNTRTKNTRTINGNENPTWNQNIDFGIDTWRSLKVQVFDSDTGNDDALSSPQTFVISPGSHTQIKHCANNGCRGYIRFDYHF